MINIFNFFNKARENTIDNKYNTNEDLVKYFKSEYGSSWKLELDKYLIKEEDNVKKVA